MRRADEHHVTEAAGDQLDPPEYEGPHQDLAELGVGLHQGQQLLTSELDHLARLGHARAYQRAPAGEHVDLSRELAGAVDGDHRFLAPAGLTISTEPAVTTKNGMTLAPASTSTSPRVT